MKYFSVFLFLFTLVYFPAVHAATPEASTAGTPKASTASPLVGQLVMFNTSDGKSQSSYLYDYGDGSSDLLGKHTYTVPAAYTVTITDLNSIERTPVSLAISVTPLANIWVKKQTVKASSAGQSSWQMQLIYNADRTSSGIFNPGDDLFVTSLGNVSSIQINAGKFLRAQPKFYFNSPKETKPAIAAAINESYQTINLSSKGDTFAGAVPAVISNIVQMGATTFSVDTALSSNGTFTANSGYRSAAFVVAMGKLKIKFAGKDSASFSLLLGDPAFKFPGTSGSRTVRFQVLNSAGVSVIDKDFTSFATFSDGKLTTGKDVTTPIGKLRYDSLRGKMTAAFSKATFTNLMLKTEENVRVNVTIGDQIYSTLITLFAPNTGSYSTRMGKGSGPVSDTPVTPAETVPPTVVATIPLDGATDVSINQKVSATFNEAMDPATISSSSFTLQQGATFLSGAVSFTGMTATFTSNGNFAINTLITATLTTAVKDVAGNAMASNYVWSFTTGSTADSTAPIVLSTNPADSATNVAINRTVNATFNEAMDPTTLNTLTFTLTGPGSTPVSGTVSYNTVSKIATFTSSSDLAVNTLFTATITTGVRDLASNGLATNKIWSFTTGTQQALKPVPLGMASPFGTFGGGAGMTNQGILTVVNGDIGTTGASTTVTGFHDSVGDIYTETPLNKGKVNGRIYTAPPTPGGAGVGGNATTFSIATQAASAAQNAYNMLTPASLPGGTDPGAGQLGGLTLAPGIYKSAGATFQITGSDLTLDAQGDTNAVFVFQMAASLMVGSPGAPRSVNLINGAQAKNVFWQVGSSATINAAGGGTMVGTIIASSGVTFSTAGNVALVTLNGRALALNASTTLVNTVINTPAP